MNLVTKIPVTYNNGLTNQGSGIVEGYLVECVQQLRNNIITQFSYSYKTESGELLTAAPLNLKEEEVNGLYEVLKDSIPTTLSYTQKNLYLYYLGMRVKMAETFGITVDDIEFTPTLKQKIESLLNIVLQINNLKELSNDEEELIQLAKLKLYLGTQLESEEYLSLSEADKKQITDSLK